MLLNSIYVCMYVLVSTNQDIKKCISCGRAGVAKDITPRIKDKA